MEFDEIKSNWGVFESLLQRLSDDHINSLLEALGDRLITCPESTRLDQYGCYPGGFVEHALQVTANMKMLNESFEFDVPTASVLKVGLLHNIGKVGDLDEDHFVEQESDWHKEKLGQMYKYNDNIQKMSISHRTLYLLQCFGVELTRDEWIAIQLAQGSHFEENRFYVSHEPTLAVLLQHAKSIVIHKKKIE